MSSLGIRKRGKAWQIVIDVGTKEKRQQKVFTFYGTKPEARAEEARLKALYKQGSALPGKMTVEEYMLYWLDTYKKRKLAEKTDTLEVGDRIEPQDRWAIVAWIRALQLSQHAPAADLPQALQERLSALPATPREQAKGAPQ